MKLNKIYISSFGKLKDFSLDFNDNLNVIKQENGWGKTTLATFISSIFYGLDDSRKNVSDNERKKYKPWNSNERFGGFIEFKWGSYSFRLERYFGNKESEDSIRLTDLKTGKDSQDTENLGERIFGIDKEGFTSTTYFSQKGLEVKVNSSITAKINSELDNNGEDVFDKAISILDKKAKEYKTIRGDKGIISNIQNDIYINERDYEVAKGATLTINTVKVEIESETARLEEIKRDLDILLKDKDKSSKLEAIKLKKDRYNSLKTECDSLSQKLCEIENKLNKNYPTDSELDLISKKYTEVVSLNEKIKAFKESVANFNANKEQQSYKIKMPKSSFLMLILSFSLLFVAGIVGFIIKFPIYVNVLFIVFGALLLALYIFLYKRFSCTNQEGTKNQVSDTLKDRLNEVKIIEDRLAVVAEELTDFAKKFNIDSKDYLLFISSVKSLVSEANLIKKELFNKKESLSNFAQDKDVFEEISSDFSAENIDNKIRQKRLEYEECNSKIASKKASLERLYDSYSSLIDLENKKAELSEKLQEATSEYNTLNLTIEMLSKADENIKSKYREPLNNSFNKYLKLIDNSNDFSTDIDIDMNVKVHEIDGSKETAYYSTGYQNLFEICKRFSLIDVLFTSEKPFIILDDPFTNLDEEKIKSSKNLLSKLAENYQIIYLVCHNSRC